jgi:UDP-N-acetylmuramoyl-L-alanyl-D-glutamate--2,6-diaminopimelate ligase
MTVPPPQDRSVDLARLLKGWVADEAIPSLSVTGIESDSRKLGRGMLFLATSGLHRHGLEFLDSAIAASVAAVAYDPQGAGSFLGSSDRRVPLIEVPGLTRNLGVIAARFYDEPSASLKVIAVTGTNGKTSCTHFLAEALQGSVEAAVIGTLGWGRPGHLHLTQHTTPEPVELQRILASLEAEGCQMVAMEASSHGLEQGRLSGVQFQGAVFTNFSRDHLDYHGTMEAYLEAKLALAEWPKLQFVAFNAEEAFAAPIAQRVGTQFDLLGFCAETYETALEIPLLRYGTPTYHQDGMQFDVLYQGRRGTVRTALYGDFNIENLTATLAAMLCLGIDFDMAVAQLGLVAAVPGRMERVKCSDRQVVVDYAHTPDALATVLEGLRKHDPKSLWVIFGCGGDRDRGKRPEMGAVASAMADHIVLTDDNPRTENGDDIIRDILSGVSCPDAIVIRDRRAAIRHALGAIGPDDLLVVAGKGHETTQDVAGIKYPFNDRAVIEETWLDLLKGAQGSAVESPPQRFV